jgi:hypothetical protein
LTTTGSSPMCRTFPSGRPSDISGIHCTLG